jgi:competence protein ComEC
MLVIMKMEVKLVSYFKSLGISEFKYVVGTHAHEDHIGGYG